MAKNPLVAHIFVSGIIAVVILSPSKKHMQEFFGVI